jgi:hypothetical protein
MEKPNFETHGTQCIPLSLPKPMRYPMKRPMRYPMKRPIANMAINKQTIKNTSTVILNTVIINIELCNIFVKYLQITNQKLVGIALQADNLKV